MRGSWGRVRRRLNCKKIAGVEFSDCRSPTTIVMRIVCTSIYLTGPRVLTVQFGGSTPNVLGNSNTGSVRFTARPTTARPTTARTQLRAVTKTIARGAYIARPIIAREQ